jgi:LmbE family N-acetylglucosaminyl deacetylase
MHILCIGAHQDDIELHCLGTMIKYRNMGHSITQLVLTNGDKGGQFDLCLSYKEVAEIRRAESLEMAAKLGSRYICLDENDEYLRDTDELRNKVTDVIREVNADIVFAPPLIDYNMDHIIAGDIAFQASMFSAIKTIRTKHDSTLDYPAYYQMEPIGGVGFMPTHYVDIADVFAEKCELIKCHASQMKQMASSGGWDLVEYSEIVGRFRGLQSRTMYAESFAISNTWPRVTAKNNLLP